MFIFQAWYQTQLRGEVLDYLAELVNSGKIDPVINVHLINAHLINAWPAENCSTCQHANNLLANNQKKQIIDTRLISRQHIQ
jgi:hypothetical protein